MGKMTALLLVDVQSDFMPGGALAVPNGIQILPAINRLLSRNFDLIVASKDWHPKHHGSFAATHGKHPGDKIQLEGLEQILWPVHCLQGTEGADFSEGWDHTKVEYCVYKGIEKNLDSYSAFFDNAALRSTGLFELLKEKQINTLYIAGLATDYCVKYSVFDALNLGFEVYVITDGCAGINLNPDDVNKALIDMEQAGACLIDSNQAMDKNN
jgi:nicotinamidase/pyrazinamidase